MHFALVQGATRRRRISCCAFLAIHLHMDVYIHCSSTFDVEVCPLQPLLVPTLALIPSLIPISILPKQTLSIYLKHLSTHTCTDISVHTSIDI